MSASSAQKCNFKESISWERCLTVTQMGRAANTGLMKQRAPISFPEAQRCGTGSTAARPLTLQLTLENSTIQALIPRHLPENNALQKEALLPLPQRNRQMLAP